MRTQETTSDYSGTVDAAGRTGTLHLPDTAEDVARPAEAARRRPRPRRPARAAKVHAYPTAFDAYPSQFSASNQMGRVGAVHVSTVANVMQFIVAASGSGSKFWTLYGVKIR